MIDNKEYCLTTGHFSKHCYSNNLTVAEYVEKYEPVEIRPVCTCGKLTEFQGVDGSNWCYLKVCGDKACAKAARAAGLRAMSPEERSEKMGKAAWATLNADPERKAKAVANTIKSNRTIGEDGLTGYERTAKKRRETLLAKHGDAYYANPDKARKTKAAWSDEQRDENAKKRSTGQMSISAEDKAMIKAKVKATNIERHGMECPANKHSFVGYSKIASDLFQKLSFNEAIFKPQNKEFSINGKLFDYAYKNKLIEFNGDYWHANPKKYAPDYQVGRSRKKTALDIWKADAAKIQMAEDAGFEVKVIWESDYKRNPDKIIKECQEWLLK